MLLSKVSTAFFEKKTAKKLLLTVGFGVVGASARNEQKFFGSYFQKRASSFSKDHP
jgi:hypothetical protein